MKALKKEPFVISIAAPTKSGKSYFVKKLLSSGLLKQFDKVHILCPSLTLNEDYEEFFNHKKILLYPYPLQSDLEKIFNDQKELKEKMIAKRRAQTYNTGKLYKKPPNIQENIFKKKYERKCPKILVILDDCIDSGVLDFKGVVDKYAERGRHLDINGIFISQRLSAISRSVRINSTYFIIFRPFSISEIEQYLEQFVSKHFKKVLYHIIEKVFSVPHQFLLLDNRADIPITERFKVGLAQDFVRDKMTILDMTNEALQALQESLKATNRGTKRQRVQDDESSVEKRPKFEPKPKVEDIPNPPTESVLEE